MVTSEDRLARTTLSFLADPADEALGRLLGACEPAEVIAAVSSGRDPQAALPAAARGLPGLDRAFARWRARLGQVPPAGQLAVWARDGVRLLVPRDPEWPTQLDDLGAARPVALWVRGEADLRFAGLRSVSVVGSRAATAYGTHVSTELTAMMAERGWSVISGGAFGVDSCAHRGALAVGGQTVAVLASGLSYGYPRGHHELFAAIAQHGALVSEVPPDRAPTRPGFLIRNRVIAALSRGTVVVEAALRSGALNTARHARDLRRPLMAVPGPVTSEHSAGCHELIREWGALLVTGARDVMEHIAPVGTDLAGPRLGPAVPRDHLDPVTTSVLEAVPARGGRGPAAIAVLAGVDLDTALRCLGLLAAAGFISRTGNGWRIRPLSVAYPGPGTPAAGTGAAVTPAAVTPAVVIGADTSPAVTATPGIPAADTAAVTGQALPDPAGDGADTAGHDQSGSG
ncbi:MAG TPA: DNA-processing protein DprA [Streptosporangiaceae bacterium]|nr:DNA-processing protein DprA [Streptosporangiaceae bacterium]